MPFCIERFLGFLSSARIKRPDFIYFNGDGAANALKFWWENPLALRWERETYDPALMPLVGIIGVNGIPPLSALSAHRYRNYWKLERKEWVSGCCRETPPTVFILRACQLGILWKCIFHQLKSLKFVEVYLAKVSLLHRTALIALN